MEPYLVVPVIQAVLSLLLIPMALKGHIRESAKKLFVLYMSCMVLWGIFTYLLRASTDESSGIIWSKALISGGLLLSAIIFHFSARYSETECRKWSLPVVYGVTSALALFSIFGPVVSGAQAVPPVGYIPEASPLLFVMASVALIILVLSFICVIQSIRKAVYSREKTRDIYIFTGILILVAGSTFDFLPMFDVPLYPGSAVASSVFFVLVVAALLKYRLVEVQRLLRKGITHITVIVLLGLLYGISTFISHAVSGEGLPVWAHLLVLVVLVLMLRILWDKIESVVDRLFYRERYAFLNELSSFVMDSHDISDYRQLGYSFVTLISRAFQSKCVSLMMRSDSGALETIAVSSDDPPPISFSNDSPVIQWMNEGNRILNTRDIEMIPQLKILTDAEKNDILEKEIDLIVPLKASVVAITGLLIICGKESGGLYSEDEMDLLAKIAEQVVNELENARIYHYEMILTNELQTQAERKTEFLHSVAHELKTPLTSLLSSTELLEEDIDTITVSQRDRIINNIQRSATSMDRRVSELLDFARSQTGSLELKLTPAKIDSMIAEVIDRMIPLIEDRNQKLELDIQDSLPFVYADTDKLEQVLVNMVSNASKYSSSESEISVRARVQEDSVIIEVEDAASQIEEEEKDRIFEPYYRGTTKNNKGNSLPGLGLGLAISKQIVELHKGKIGVESIPGKGNIFYFSVPVFEEE